MLFHASLAVGRVAWCLMQAISAANDHFVLLHRGFAMTAMRQLIESHSHTLEVELIFSIGRMLSIAVRANIPFQSMFSLS